jgi:hypothetical protein
VNVWHARRPGWNAEPLWLRALRAVATLVVIGVLVAALWFDLVMVLLASTPAPK